MNVEILEKYQCGSCSTWYADTDEDEAKWPGDALDAQEAARLCCAPEISRMYFCSICKEAFWRYADAKKHIDIPHGTSELGPNEKYIDLLFEGVPPVDAWQQSHQNITDDRRVIEEVLLRQ